MSEYLQDAKVKHSLTIISKALWEHERIALACSFGKDSIVALHLARRIDLDIPVFAIMTPFKPKETFTFMEQVKKEWNLNLKVYQSKEKVAPDLHKTDPDKCCYLLKVKPTMEAVKNLDAWITGLRQSEGYTRQNFKEVEFRGLFKINPIVDWTEGDAWRYIAIHKLPVHPYYKRGYRSIGCACCSAPNTETERGGRWKGTSKCGGECGIHTCDLKS